MTKNSFNPRFGIKLESAVLKRMIKGPDEGRIRNKRENNYQDNF